MMCESEVTDASCERVSGMAVVPCTSAARQPRHVIDSARCDGLELLFRERMRAEHRRVMLEDLAALAGYNGVLPCTEATTVRDGEKLRLCTEDCYMWQVPIRWFPSRRCSQIDVNAARCSFLLPHSIVVSHLLQHLTAINLVHTIAHSCRHLLSKVQRQAR